jgi:hypothetical protein
MEYIEDFSDERLKAWCIQCGAPATEVELTRDHVPSKSLLSRKVVEAGAEFDRGEGGLRIIFRRSPSASHATAASRRTRAI